MINVQKSLGVATIDSFDRVDAMLAAPTSGHPDGTTVVFAYATAPAQGLTPEQDDSYILIYDNQSGALLAKNNLGPTSAECMATNDPTIGRWRSRYFHDDPRFGRQRATNSRPALTNYRTGRELRQLSQLRLLDWRGLGRADHRRSQRHRLWCRFVVVDAISLKQLSTSPCFHGLNNGSSAVPTSTTAYQVTCDGGAGGCSNSTDLLSIASGQPITASVSSDPINPPGPRSAVEAAIAPSGSPVYFVDQSTDAVIYTVSQASQLNLQIYGEADDDFWVETTSGNIVVNDNGSQIANDWSWLLPMAEPDGPSSGQSMSPRAQGLRASGTC